MRMTVPRISSSGVHQNTRAGSPPTLTRGLSSSPGFGSEPARPWDPSEANSRCSPSAVR